MIVHGRYWQYVGHGCRCPSCREAWRWWSGERKGRSWGSYDALAVMERRELDDPRVDDRIVVAFPRGQLLAPRSHPIAEAIVKALAA